MIVCRNEQLKILAYHFFCTDVAAKSIKNTGELQGDVYFKTTHCTSFSGIPEKLSVPTNVNESSTINKLVVADNFSATMSTDSLDITFLIA